MNPIKRSFRFLTAAFPHGAYQSTGFNRPDLRPPSISGQLRWWFDALYGRKTEEDKIFGGLENWLEGRNRTGAEAARIVVRLCLDSKWSPNETEFMPHKGKSGGNKNAIPSGTVFTLTISYRRQKLTDEQIRRLERILDAWLMFGAVGQRANRAAGSVWPVADPPLTAESYMARANDLLGTSKLRCALLNDRYDSEHRLRYDAGDFIKGPTVSERRGTKFDTITEKWWPFGSDKDRKPSPLKLRAVQLDGALRLAAIWDGRHHSPGDLRKGVEKLSLQKQLGHQLKAVLPQLCS